MALVLVLLPALLLHCVNTDEHHFSNAQHLPLGTFDIARIPPVDPSSAEPVASAGQEIEEVEPEDASVVPWPDRNTYENVSLGSLLLQNKSLHEVAQQNL